MSSTIQLAKGYQPSKLVFPVMVSEKLDGVPTLMNFMHQHDSNVGYAMRSRQDKPLPSIRSQVQHLAFALGEACSRNLDMEIVAEVTHTTKGMPFKDVSGHVRRQEQNDDLVLNIFDGVIHGFNYEQGFGTRIMTLDNIIRGLGVSPGWRIIPQMMCYNQKQLDCALRAMTTEHDGWLAEGAVVRSCSETWQPGKRTWGYQKYVIDPTIELEIVDFEEAESKDGEPLGMVGRIVCAYKNGTTGVGPGKLTHTERRNLWTLYCEHDVPKGTIITVKHKRDTSYTKLRQPTFQHFRPELCAGSIEARWTGN